MVNYEKARAVQELRYIKPSEEARRDRSRQRRRHWSLPDLLGALAGRLAAIGIQRKDGKRRPASPAF
ncbi:MAG: hypothetical protein ACLFRT_03370 [Actinomycetota bacterium]